MNGRVLVYDFSVSDLWAAGKRPASTPPAGSIPPAVAWDRDVLALIPATEEILCVNSAWCLTADSSPLMKLALWRPTDDTDQIIRWLLLTFGHEVVAAERLAYAVLTELVFKDEVTGLYNIRFFSTLLTGGWKRDPAAQTNSFGTGCGEQALELRWL